MNLLVKQPPSTPKINNSMIIPHTKMRKRYEDLAGLRTMSDQLKAARETDAGVLAADFAASVKDFDAYENGEPFFEKRRRPLKDPLTIERINRTEYFASVLESQKAVEVVDYPELGFQYAEREIVPSRTTGGAHYSNGNDARNLIRFDLLLFGDLPILGELKLPSDSTAIYALVQLLASASELASPKQRDRLFEHCLRDWQRGGDDRFDLYLIFFNFNRRSKPRCEVLDRTNKLVADLLTYSQINKYIRRIAAFDSDWKNRKSLSFSPLFAHSS
jgi:hypothetical protein